MLIVCNLQLWSVYEGIVGSKEGEADREEDGKADRCSQTCKDRVLCQLFGVSYPLVEMAS